jgi:hypothetical protein
VLQRDIVRNPDCPTIIASLSLNIFTFWRDPAFILAGKGAVSVFDTEFVVEPLLVDSCIIDLFSAVEDVEFEIGTPTQWQ